MIRIILRGVLLLAALRALGAFLTRAGTEGDAASDDFSIVTVFGGANRVSRAASLRQGRVTVAFGGVELDLRQATLAADGADLTLRSYVGGIQVTVPEGWRVVVDETSTAGGIDIHVTDAAALDEGAPTLRIDASATLGGIQVTAGDDDTGPMTAMGEDAVLDG